MIKTILQLTMFVSYKPVKKASLKENLYHNNFIDYLLLTPLLYPISP